MGHRNRSKNSSRLLALLFAVIMLFSTVPVTAAPESEGKTTLAFWNFEESASTAEASAGNEDAVWTTDTATPAEIKEPTNAPSGTAQGKVLEAIGWSVGKSWSTVISTEGFQNIDLSAVLRSSATGAKYWKAEYSLDGSTWNEVKPEFAVGNNWTTGRLEQVILPAEANNQKTVHVRFSVTQNIQVSDESKNFSSKAYTDLDDVRFSADVYADQGEDGSDDTSAVPSKEGVLAAWDFESGLLPSSAQAANADVQWSADTEKPINAMSPTNSTTPSAVAQGLVLETTGWKPGKSWNTVISTEGYQSLKLSYVQRSSNSGPKYWRAEYSLDGSDWKALTQEYAVANDWETGRKTDIVLPAEADNQKAVYIRLVVTKEGQVSDDNKTISGGGYNDLDDVKITGEPYSAVPGILRIDFTANATGGNYWWGISQEPYVFQEGDVISYDVYLSTDAAGIGGVEVYCTGNGTNDFKFREHVQAGEWTDQEGMSGIPSTDISSKAYGSWYHRELPVPASATGLTLRDFCLGIDNGSHQKDDVLTAFYDNIQVVHDGNPVLTIYEEGEPALSQKVSPDNNTSYDVKLQAVRSVDAVIPGEPDTSNDPLEVEAQNFGVSLTLGSTEMKASTGYNIDTYTIETAPEKQGDTIYVPLYPVMEAMGADVQWDGDSQTVTIRQAKNVITHKLGTASATVNGAEKPLNPDGDTEAVSYARNSSSIMVPLSFFTHINGKATFGKSTGLIKVITPIVNVSYSSAPEEPVTPLDIPDSDISFRFVVSSDSQGVDEGLKDGKDDGTGPGLDAVLNQISQLDYQPQFIIGAGDLVAGTMNKIPSELKAQLTNFRSHYTKVFNIDTFLPIIGNHEQKGSVECQQMFTSMFSEFTDRPDIHFCEGYNNTVWYYDDEASNTRIFALNTNNPGEEHKIMGKQLEWLKANISSSVERNIFIMHEPAYSTWHYGNAMDRQVQARDEFWNVVESANNPMVFCGHEHLYSRKLVNSRFNETIGGTSYTHEKQIYQVHIGGFGGGTNGTANNYKGVLSRPESMGVNHFAVVDILKDGRIHVQAIDKDGNLLDDFVQSAADTEVVTPFQVSFEKNEVSLEIGESVSLPVTEKVPVSYQSGDETIARVDEQGNVTAVGNGTVYITATANGGAFASCKITVGNPELKPDRITVTFDGDARTERGFTWYTKAQAAAPEVEVSKGASFKNSPAVFKAESQAAGGGFMYKAKAVGLEPSTVYYYRVGDGESNEYSQTGTFVTGKETGAFSFIHLTDTQADNREEARISANTVETALETVTGAEFIIHGGDIVENGTNEEMWQNFLNLSQNSLMQTTLAPVAGNHERQKEAFIRHFNLDTQGSVETGAYYSYDYSNAHFVVLNTNDGSNNISEEQLEWMRKDVTQARKAGAEWVIVGMHKGPYSTGSHVDDDDILSMREEIIPVMDELDIDLVLEGHDHVFARTKVLKYDPNGPQYSAAQETTVITESDGNMSAEYTLGTDGTVYVISNTAGAKLYGEEMTSSKVDLNAFWEMFEKHLQPAGQSPVRGSVQNFTGVTVDEGRLKVVVYEIANGQVTVRDSFGIDKEVPEVIEAIDKLPKADQVTLKDREQIEAVRVLLDSLTEDQKVAVSNAADLEAAEAKLKELEDQQPDEQPGGNTPGDENPDEQPGVDTPGDQNPDEQPGGNTPGDENPGEQPGADTPGDQNPDPGKVDTGNQQMGTNVNQQNTPHTGDSVNLTVWVALAVAASAGIAATLYRKKRA